MFGAQRNLCFGQFPPNKHASIHADHCLLQFTNQKHVTRMRDFHSNNKLLEGEFWVGVNLYLFMRTYGHAFIFYGSRKPETMYFHLCVLDIHTHGVILMSIFPGW